MKTRIALTFAAAAAFASWTASAAPPTSTPGAAPATTPGMPSSTTPTARPSSPTTSTGQPTSSANTAAEFKTEADAKGHCPGDTVVWANTKTMVYHFAGAKTYGHTKAGAYMCERDTAGAGFHAAKHEKHP